MPSPKKSSPKKSSPKRRSPNRNVPNTSVQVASVIRTLTNPSATRSQINAALRTLSFENRMRPSVRYFSRR